MNGANGRKESTRVGASGAPRTLGVNVFTAPGKAMAGQRPNWILKRVASGRRLAYGGR